MTIWGVTILCHLITEAQHEVLSSLTEATHFGHALITRSETWWVFFGSVEIDCAMHHTRM